jgi:ATP/maltotriose-dependent transcriptional regulator MalT
VKNPFRPTFGALLPHRAGRDAVVATVADALDEGVGSPGRATLITGPRGTGKTVLLASIANEARQRDWWVITESASPGMIERFVSDHLPAALDELHPTASRSRLNSVTAPLGLGGASWDRTEPFPRTRSFRSWSRPLLTS